MIQQENLLINYNLLHNKDIQTHRCPIIESWLDHQLNRRRGFQTTPGLRSAYVSLPTAYLWHPKVELAQNPQFECEDWCQGGRSPE